MPTPRAFFAGRGPRAAAFLSLVVLVAGGLSLRPADRATSMPGTWKGARGPGAADDWFLAQRMSPEGTLDYAARFEAIRVAREMKLRAEARGELVGAPAWQPLGPTNVGGRITDLVADPANPNLIYIGAASGGVWKTTDGGSSWSPVFDGQGSQSIGAIAMAPDNPSVIYVGTGEANPGGGSVAYGGDGVWKTTDGGATWSHLGLEATRVIGRMAIDPVNPSRVFVAAMGNLFSTNPERGLYRSTNGGASWSQVLFVSDSTGCVDVAIDPSNPNRIFAATWERIRHAETRRYGGPTSGVWRSLDGGDTWTPVGGGLPLPSTNPGRIGIAIAPSDPLTVYAVYYDTVGDFAGFFRSTDGGTTWTRRPDGTALPGDSSYGWWFARVWVDPSNKDRVWVHGVSLYRSTVGGGSWSTIGGFTLHADHHAQWFRPSDPNLILEGNDGGLYRSTNGGTNWTKINNLPITQFYTLDVHPSQTFKPYGGAQDNGTNRTPAGAPGGWEEVLGGDGHYVNVDPNNTNVIYAEYQYGAFFKSTDGGGSFSSATTGISGGDRKNWSSPVVIDPASAGDPQTTLYFGANRLYRSTNSAGSWTAVSPDLSDGFGGSGGVVYGTITTIAVAPSDSATIYAGTDDGNVWVTTNRGTSWTRIDTALPDRWITRVAVDHANDAVAYVTLSGFRWDEPLSHVFRTTDWGANWSDISGDLPDAPVNDIVIDPRNASVLYAATDVGVFVSANLGAAWGPCGNGLPEGVVVNDLKFIDGTSPALFAATYGRSMYRLDVGTTTSVAQAPGTAGGQELALAPGRPNPWRDATTIGFTLPAPGPARMTITDVTGRRIATVLDASLPAGTHQVTWDGRDAAGGDAPPGVYFYRLEAADLQLTRKMIRTR